LIAQQCGDLVTRKQRLRRLDMEHRLLIPGKYPGRGICGVVVARTGQRLSRGERCFQVFFFRELVLSFPEVIKCQVSYADPGASG